VIAEILPAVARLARTPRTWLWSSVWASVAIAFAIHARQNGWPHGASDALLGPYAALVLPLLAYVLVRGTVGPGSLGASIRPLVGLGASPWKAAAGTGLVAMAACALGGAALGATVAMAAHGTADPPVVRDALTSAYAGAVGGVAYAAVLVAGTRLGGFGALACLAVDWVLGAGSGEASIVVPRAHLRNLLGGVAPMGMAGRASAVALVMIGVVGFALAVVRKRG